MSLIDGLRAIPEMAVRIFCGAKFEILDVSEGKKYHLSFDGQDFDLDEKTFESAVSIARALSIRITTEVRCVSDILDLRHAAEDLYIEELINIKDVPQILFVPAGDMASAYYRAMFPADILLEHGLAIAHFTHKIDITKAIKYNVLWIQLVASPMLVAIVQKAKEAGVKIVYDVDDKFDVIPEDNPAAEIYAQHKAKDAWDLIGLADIVTVSTKDLADHVRKAIPDKVVKVLPNMIPASVWPPAAPANDDFVRILWAGSPTHKRDLAIVAPALLDILADGGGKVRFTCFGEQIPEELDRVREFVDIVKFVPFSEYGQALADIGADLMIAPLENTSFNRSKSAIKVLEAGATGYPLFCSPVGEYLDVKEQGAPITLVRDDEWKSALSFAVSRRQILPGLAERLKKWVKVNRCVNRTQAKNWLEVADELVASRV